MMQKNLIGKWVEVTLSNNRKWIGYLEEWDDEALFISNGKRFGEAQHKGAECTNGELVEVIETEQRNFSVC